MKRNILLLWLAMLVSALVSGQPVIDFNNTTHDFGDVLEGTLPGYTFGFKNTGNQPLFIENVKAACGCTSPSWSRDTVQPGDSGFVKAVFNTAGYKNRDFQKSVSVFTNIPEGTAKKVVTLIIKGHVLEKMREPAQYPISYSEIYHDFGNIKQGKSSKWQVTIKNEGDSTITIKEVTGTACPDCYKFKVVPNVIPPKTDAILYITYSTKTLQPKRFSEMVKVTTNLPESITKKISFYGISLTGEITEK